ncbi:MAG: hypothetical protein ACPHQ9_12965 [Marinobacter sp.]|uniref:hypothetical protein n=1 Tax=Marinobacter sp. TaxID=50741 RepID=UPI003C4C5BA3
MKLMKATRFREEYFAKGSEPSMNTLKKLIDEGGLPGRKIGVIHYVDLDQLSKSDNPLVNRVLAA